MDILVYVQAIIPSRIVVSRHEHSHSMFTSRLHDSNSTERREGREVSLFKTELKSMDILDKSRSDLQMGKLMFLRCIEIKVIMFAIFGNNQMFSENDQKRNLLSFA